MWRETISSDGAGVWVDTGVDRMAFRASLVGDLVGDAREFKYASIFFNDLLRS